MGIFCLLGPEMAIAGEGAVIDSIDASGGARIVILKTPTGNRPAERGMAVSPGDRLKTNAHTSVRIRYPDGSILLIGKNSEVEVQAKTGGTQWNEVAQGEVRGIVKKAREGEGGANAPLHRFGIKTRGAVMGVRGTDFVFSATQQAATQAQVHTLEGVVEVAKDQPTLVAGKGVRVEAGQYTGVTEQAVEAPKAFDPGEYFRKLESQQPSMARLAREEEKKRRDEELQNKPAPEPTPTSASNPTYEEVIAAEKEAEKRKKEEAKARRPFLQLLKFQVGAVKYIQRKTQAEWTTYQVAWRPEMRIPVLPFVLIGHLAGAQLRTRSYSPNAGEPFYATQAGALLGLTLLEPLRIEVGPGGEWWLNGHGERGFLAMANVAILFENNKLIDRVYLGYAHYDKPNPVNNSRDLRNPANEIRAGLGVSF